MKRKMTKFVAGFLCAIMLMSMCSLTLVGLCADAAQEEALLTETEADAVAVEAEAAEDVEAQAGSDPLIIYIDWDFDAYSKDTDFNESNDVLTVPFSVFKRGKVVAKLSANDRVTFSSFDPMVAKVDKDGNVTLTCRGPFHSVTTITAYSLTDGSKHDIKLVVSFQWWQYIVWGLFSVFYLAGGTICHCPEPKKVG